MLVRSGITIALLSLILTFTAVAQTSDLQQKLTEEYQGKIFALRGFYSSDDLEYNASGTVMGNPGRGFWTINGFVFVSEIKPIDHAVLIKGRRMFVVSHGHGLEFQADNPKKRKKTPRLEIEAALGPNRSLEEAHAVLNKIFLTNADSILAVIPTYWRTCVSAGVNQINDPRFSACRFSQELLAVPGMNANADLRASSTGTTVAGPPTAARLRVFHVGTSVSPPTPTYKPEPQFSNAAREAGVQGALTLGLIVDNAGTPQNIEILSPLGAGLDEEAVGTVSAWRFSPAQKDGHPVAVEIAVEVDFHSF